jgi:uncharacterized membrane protein YkvA (DUF1232 family)
MRLLPRMIQVKVMVSLALVLVYVVLPVDVIPDFAGLLGLLDDAIVVTLMGLVIANVLLNVLA